MSDRTKRILFIIAFVLAAGLLAYALYFILFGATSTPTTPTNQINQGDDFSGGLPPANTGSGTVLLNVNGRLVPSDEVDTTPPATSTASPIARGGTTQVTQVSTTPIESMYRSSDGNNLVGYNPNDGKFYKYNADGSVTALSDDEFFNVDEVTWAPDSAKAIMKFPDGATIYYNFLTKEQKTLPNHWEEFDFSDDSTKIAFKNMRLDRENRWLSVANADGSQVRNIAPVGDNSSNISVLWSPTGQVVGNYRQSMDFDRQRLIFITTDGTELPAVVLQGRGLEQQYSPDGEFLFYSVYSSFTDLQPNLWFTTARGDQSGLLRVNLELNTWADKCAFADGQTVYCAVPQYLPKGAGLVPEVADSIPDDFYKIDLQSGAKTLIATTEDSYTAENIVVSQDGRNLFFTDTATGTAQQIRIR